MRITTLFFRSVLFGLLMMLFSLNVKGAYSGTGTFTKITSLSDLTDGYYVIAFGTTYAMSNSYVSSTYLDRLAISPTGGNTITNPDETIVWRITTDGTKKTIYSEDTDKYISYTGSSNNVQVVSAVSSDNQRWTFNYVSNLFTITNAALTTRLLQYNNNSGSYRFVCYTGSQQNLTLYKLQTPTINVSSSLSNFTYKHENGPSVIQSFTVSGSSLEANVIVSSQTNSNYEISETGGDGFSAASSITITPASGSVSNKSVYVRLKAGLQVGTYNNEVIDITCSGVDAKTVTCSGSVSDCDDPDLAFSSNLPTTKTDKDASFEAIASSNNTNGTIVYSSSNESVATVNSSTGEIDLLSVGDVTITATLAASNGYCSDLDTYSFTVIQSTKTDQIITFNPLASVTYGGNSFNLTATASSGLTVTYESSDLTVATVLGNTVTIVGAGETTITARQEGNDTYNSATEIDRILTVDPKELSIPDAVVTPKTYNDSTAAIITGTLTGIVNSDDVDFVGTGIFDSENAGVNIPVTANCTLTGNDTGNYFLTQPTGLTGTINKATQTLTFNAMSLKYVGDSDFDPGATASSGLTVTYQSSNPAVATIVSGMVHIVGEGMSVITASQEGNGNYEAAADEQHTLTVKVAPTEIAVWNFNGVANAGVATWPGIFSEGLNTTSETNNITRGDDAPVSTGTNSFRTQGFKNDGISISNTDYFQVTIQPVSGYKVSLARIDANFAGTATFYANSGVASQFAYSVDNGAFNLIGVPVMSTSTSLNLWFDLSGVPELQNVTGKTITLRYYASGQTATGGWGFSSPNSSTNGLSISGYVELTTPVVTVSASSLTGFNYTYGTTSETEESFTVKGVRLTDNITITPSTNYEISQASGESFNAESSIVLLPTNGNVTETAIYVRLKNGLNVGNYNDEVINIVSDQAESELVICSGSVSCADPGLSFTTTPASKNFGDAPFIIEAASSLSSGTVSYESSNLAVATVNQSTGEVFIAAVGTTTLKATITANGNYCEDEAEFLLTVSAVKPTVVSTGEVPEYIKATVSGRISSTGGSGITESGAYWSTTSGFADGEGTKVSADNLEDSNFTVTITGLEQNTTYYYKLYAINSEGTAYSLQGSFATLRIITKPVVDIPVISAIGATQAALSATIGLDGGATITAQGFYYSTTNGFADGEGTQVTSGNVENKTFSAGLSNLTCGTTYYVRAYATNSAGTAYSVQQSFITATPSLIIDPVALNGFTYVSGSNTPSAEQSFNVSGTHLAGNITVTPSANYEISKNTGSNFAAANSIILSPVNEILASNTIYVRLKTGLNVGNYNETISIATTGVAAQTVTCNGSVSKNDTSDEMVFADDKLAVRSAGKQLFVQGLHSAATVTLYDVTGKVMASYAGVDNNFPVTVDLAGVFVVKVRNATQSITARMILK